MQRKAIIYLTASAIFAGSLLSLLMSAYTANNQSTNLETTSATIIQLELEMQQLQAENRTLQSELEALNATPDQEAVANQHFEEARMSAGLTGLSGPGIRITLNDADTFQSTTTDISLGLIHEKNLRDTVNALWNAHAEGIAINGQRLTTHSEIFCNGAFILINKSLQMPPYVIETIGNQETLEKGLNFYFWEVLGVQQDQHGVTRQVELPEEPITLPAANPYTYRYAEPTQE